MFQWCTRMEDLFIYLILFDAEPITRSNACIFHFQAFYINNSPAFLVDIYTFQYVELDLSKLHINHIYQNPIMAFYQPFI